MTSREIIIKSIIGLVAIKVGILVAYLCFRFIGDPSGHRVIFWIVAAVLVAWIIGVFVWMGRQYNQWYNR